MSPSRKTWLILLGVMLAAWTVLTWPLPRHFATAIPVSGRNTEAVTARRMVPGDHLQLLYHFWLASDMMQGKTPLFHNLYEFNTGDDAARREPGSYYLPFSAIYAVLSWAGGRALGWNLASLLSMVLSLWFTWRLARRYTPSDAMAACAAIVGVVFPFRLIPLLGGSPTGFGMTMVPMALLGLDIAVRDRRMAGGWLAGVAVLLSFCSDLHVFFFTVLVTPFWCLFAALATGDVPWKKPASLLGILRALAPAMLLVAVSYLLSRATARELAGATMAGGWDLSQVAPYSPSPRDFFTKYDGGIVAQTYLGFSILILNLLGLVVLTGRALRKPHRDIKPWLGLLLLAVATVVLLELSLGTHGALRDRALIVARALIPPYRMIRQPAKIFCLLPSLLAVASALSLTALTTRLGRRAATAISLTCAAVFLVEYLLPVNTQVCLLDRDQGAYAAIDTDATERGITPRAVVLPLWQGESHWSSIYQHYASLYRLRLLNGYRPAVPRDYAGNTFKRYESLNQGQVSDNQLAGLQGCGIDYILFHEDAFPEKVSPFPASLSLKRLLNHPRLRLEGKDESVWAFRIMPEPWSRPTLGAAWRHLFPARRWEAERLLQQHGEPLADPAASYGHVLRMAATNAAATVATRAPIVPVEALHWSLLVRGDGLLGYRLDENSNTVARGELAVRGGEAWAWDHIPIPVSTNFFTPHLTVHLVEGAVEWDAVVLDGGPPLALEPGQSITIPAPVFFHAGSTAISLDTVSFQRAREPDRVILYGDFLPLMQGIYEVRFESDTAASAGITLGRLEILQANETPVAGDVVAGQPTVLTVRKQNLVPMRLEFCYFARDDMTVGDVTLTRLK